MSPAAPTIAWINPHGYDDHRERPRGQGIGQDEMYRAATFATAIFLAAAAHSQAPAPAPRRVALVIAESNYAGRNFLPNPVLDSRLVADALAKAGFQIVIVKPDLTLDDFSRTLRDFHAKAQGAEAAFIYYSGHGIQSEGHNWLIPRDATLGAENDLNLQAVSLDAVLAAADGARWKFIALDACRDSPFTHQWHGGSRAFSNKGLAPVDADNVLVMYATAQNSEAADGPAGKNSPFAIALSHALVQPGLEVHYLGSTVKDEVNRLNPAQNPFYTDSISRAPFYFIQGDVTVNVAPPATGAAPTNATVDPRALELALWTSVSGSDDVEQLNAYLHRYPSGVFADAARAKIARLARPTPASRGFSQTPAATTPTRFNKPRGYFQKSGDTWTEYPGAASGAIFTFRDAGSDDAYVYIVDRSRTKPGEPKNAMMVRLPKAGGAASWTYQDPVMWKPFARVTPDSGG